jgi:hypothetical protein
MIIFLFSILGCYIPVQDKDKITCYIPVQDKDKITMSGSAFVSMNGELKKYSELAIYGDENLTNQIGHAVVLNSGGNQGINDYSLGQQGVILADNGKWVSDIYNIKNTPITTIWIKVSTCTRGSESIIIPYQTYIHDKSITGIDLGSVELPGTRVQIHIGNNFTLGELPATIGGIVIIRGHDTMASFKVSNDNAYLFDTGIINDDDNFHINIWGDNGTNHGQNYHDDIRIRGAELKAGYTVDDIVLDQITL